MEDFIIISVLSLVAFIIFCFGGICATPDKLENGCIVYNDKIYCEEVVK